MIKAKRPKRNYDSAGRQAMAEQTRRHILEAAHRIFAERGYAGATMQLIASEAGISLQTIYANFKNKPRVLVALFNISSSSGAEENVPMLERARPQAVARERDQRRQISMFTQVVADNLTGAAPVAEILEDAARTEAEIQTILKRLNAQRLEHMGAFVRQIGANGPLRNHEDPSSARDIVWALTSPELFLLLTRDRGWSKEKYRSWLENALTDALLP
jgi:AcrR family transcriptional regulator